ncbi:Frizzled and smoothened-like protein O [Frankliniella fusca]|uniref:Frizzled and smoothened-like protein O n=1 Tax=Frankliniella fusca TaxID=407009 RepID=A0AAE1HN35_9NEOP|nr:Frizzled and smoothened-like protein O [Frankliniella fusca]
MNIPLTDVKWFISLSLRNQFKNFFALPGVARLLQYREWRVKNRPDRVEDILDGELYQEFQRTGLIGRWDLTYTFNSDGFRKFKHQSLSVWGLLIRLNELPPNLSQRNLFLGGIWIDKEDPNMNTFPMPFVSKVNSLSHHGVTWRPHGLPVAQDRPDNSIRRAMEMRGLFELQKGAAKVMHLRHFDLARGNGMDDLHPSYEGVAEFYFNLLDSILEAKFVTAENYLERVLVYFQNNFGPGKMRFNIHMLKHVVRSRRMLGPAWTISTFNFESWNGAIGVLVTAANGAIDQIVTKHMLKSYVHAVEVDEDVVVLGRPTDMVLSGPKKLAC